ncbi:orotate phosphoribosyltransferase [Neoehrlichia mikurensis]|uniref:Orotate phosphoribosyltransferase n=1 Tax=Neoehrlichia mikurensis TaxID=89586 RepID=A0A9Q9C0A0_9RICK|nr:orotate phosphoribosyltransferase [Neoehrlichia mikurensis]QXK91605.1 orotate phosphoribosyltransferase [Neoehrlichia mikurensis]QXK92816.1 orotate phosphoribosyltransferase [Neoehrlichia mikurensis]QXK93295.1 orotate phosphoribosyltransferase [Neoehrlichia mikurensis]UTO55764.1 orotate phosphoribosyltransferase [Neoehrlichia mikurensis]UTO56681.1 orotate phosphoribosyltransferase [Neoehrlichia mikurensis]
MLSENLLSIFINSGAVLKGHFILSSGVHSDTYIQCAKLFENPKIGEELCTFLIRKAQDKILTQNIDLVISPAIGGIVVGYEVAKQLGVRFVFFERVEGAFMLRRGFEIKYSDKILIVEDVITTGKSSMEILKCIGNMKDNVVGELSMVKRNNNGLSIPFPVVSLLELEIPHYADDNLPDDLKQIPAVYHGSRFTM